MSLNEILDALPALTFEERQILIRRAIVSDDPPFPEADEYLVASRLAAHRSNPTSSLSLETLKEGLRSRMKR